MQLKKPKKLFEYIAIFGPANHILIDMGNEFVAEVDQELITSCGVEHDVTAAYNPRTNGLTERFNRTLCECLRKHADGNSLDWHMS
jgi:transposase InsO family protein